MVVELPIRVRSESNIKTEHWAAKAKRVKAQRSQVALVLRGRVGVRDLPCVVELVRISPCKLDDDNIRGALKHVRDGVADALGVDDRDARVVFTYAQLKGAPRQYAVRITITPRVTLSTRVELVPA